MLKRVLREDRSEKITFVRRPDADKGARGVGGQCCRKGSKCRKGDKGLGWGCAQSPGSMAGK